jgi:hypothetical protein
LTAEVSALAQTGAKPASQRAGSGTPAGNGREIRRVDFRNFNYVSDCWKTYSNAGFNQIIHVSNGEWKHGSGSDEIYFAPDKAIYGDINGDGRDEAVVRTSCGSESYTGHHDEVFVFGVAAGSPKLLVRLSSSDLSGPSSDFVWGVSNVKIINQQLLVNYLAGGPRAQPAWDATAKFKWNGVRFVRTGINRKPFMP